MRIVLSRRLVFNEFFCAIPTKHYIIRQNVQWHHLAAVIESRRKKMDRQNLTLLTDLYELTMMQGYYKNKEENNTVIFDAFFRNNPFGGGYSIMCGIEQLVKYVKELHFSKEDVDYLRGLGIFDEDFLEYLAGFHFTGSIYAIPEGALMFPREPMVKVIAPIMEAQLVETAILNIINHQSLIATKAARICYAARGDGIMEFGLRRAQGPDAGTYGARAAVIAGCVGTSNVLCGQLFDVPVKGTHAHSWIMSFPDELTAFKTYGDLYPNACILLADTYDTLKSGVPNAIKTFQYLRDKGTLGKGYGIRLDSGDLAYISKKARKMLDEAGFPDAIISASNDLDEHLIDSLKNQGATITSWGVGTHLITAKDNPSFGGVYKLSAIQKPRKQKDLQDLREGQPQDHRRSHLPRRRDFYGRAPARSLRSCRALEEDASGSQRVRTSRADGPSVQGRRMCVYLSQDHGDPRAMSQRTGYALGRVKTSCQPSPGLRRSLQKAL